jgi:predicted Zn finger-like uncharacterized protein
MFISCPSCHTKYRLPEEVLPGTAPVFRCSRCKHTFALESTEPPQRTEETDDEQELSFAFAPNEDPEQKNQTVKGSQPAGAPYRSAESVMQTGDSTDRWWMTVSDSEPEAPFTISATEHVNSEIASDQPEQSLDQLQNSTLPRGTADKILPFDPYRDQPVSTKPFLTLFVLLLIFFSSLRVLDQTHPTILEQIVKKIPLLGPAVLKNDRLKNGVDLQSLRGSYQTIQGNREVFIVTGMAHNQNPVAVREVRIAGRIYDQEGKGIEQQTIWVGNAISAKIIRGMTAQEIADLERLPPLRIFGIPPGDSVPFAIVFMRPTKGIKDFTCEVLSVESEL